MKLHLGCGEKYLEGYVNIDFPESEQTVQNNHVADLTLDITELTYEASSIGEIRLHHVFEHFTRPVACGLITAWRSWLKPGGILRIEVPDIQRTCLTILNPLTSDHSKALALRHAFGSHEAPWAVHREGWTINRLTSLLTRAGFEIASIKKNSWQATHNFETIAKKSGDIFSKADLENRTKEFLSDYLVDFSKVELRIMEEWMDMYNSQVKRSWAKQKTISR